MERYVNADVLRKEITRLRISGLGNKHPEWHNAMWECLDAILRTPTADVREVIRCKDCKYITEHYDTDGNAPYWTCSEWDSGTDYDGFCHYAERRGGE